MNKWVVTLLGLAFWASSSAFAAMITVDFSGTSEYTTDAVGPGIYGVNSITKLSPVSGSITLNTTSFVLQGAPIDDNGSAIYTYRGGSNSSIIFITDATGSQTFSSTFTSLEVCAGCDTLWTLSSYNSATGGSVFIQALTSAIQINPSDGVSFFPTGVHPDSYNYFDGSVSQGTNDLGFIVTAVSETPEPMTLGLWAVGLVLAVMIKCQKS